MHLHLQVQFMRLQTTWRSQWGRLCLASLLSSKMGLISKVETLKFYPIKLRTLLLPMWFKKLTRSFP